MPADRWAVMAPPSSCAGPLTVLHKNLGKGNIHKAGLLKAESESTIGDTSISAVKLGLNVLVGEAHGYYQCTEPLWLPCFAPVSWYQLATAELLIYTRLVCISNPTSLLPPHTPFFVLFLSFETYNEAVGTMFRVVTVSFNIRFVLLPPLPPPLLAAHNENRVRC